MTYRISSIQNQQVVEKILARLKQMYGEEKFSKFFVQGNFSIIYILIPNEYYHLKRKLLSADGISFFILESNVVVIVAKLFFLK